MNVLISLWTSTNGHFNLLGCSPGGFFCVCVFVCFVLQADVISKLNMTDR